jgi:hypothetical protein
VALEAVDALKSGRTELTGTLTTLRDALTSGNYPDDMKRMQEDLNGDIDESNFLKLQSLGCSSAWTLFMLRSMASSTASAWLNLIPFYFLGTTMADRVFVAAIRNRLFLHPLPPPQGGGPRVPVYCASCLARPQGPTRVVFDCAHSLLCPAPSYNGEHHCVRDAIIGSVDALAKKVGGGNLLVQREAVMANLHCLAPLTLQERIERAEGASLEGKPPIERMDIYIRHLPRSEDGEEAVYRHTLLDVTLTSPPSGWVNEDAANPITRAKPLDTFIDAKIKEKIFFANTSFRPTEGENVHFYALAYDRSGRPGQDTKYALRIIKKILNTFSQSSASTHSVEQALTDRISTALQTGIGRHILMARQLHNRHIAVAAAAAAAVGGVAGPNLVPPMAANAAWGGGNVG